MTEFHRAKEADKKITEQINEALMTTFVSQLEREDMEILSASLYRIPKTVEKFAERFSALKLKVIERILWAWSSLSRRLRLWPSDWFGCAINSGGSSGARLGASGGT